MTALAVADKQKNKLRTAGQETAAVIILEALIT